MSTIQDASDLAVTASSLPDSLPADIVDFLEEEHFKDTDLSVVANFFEAAKALTDLPSFRAMKAARQAKQHCVRCHGTFTYESDGPSECVIPHVFTTEPTANGKTTGNGRVYEYDSMCCGSSVKLEEEGGGNSEFLDLDRLGYCYQDYHTADVKEVERNYNDINVRRCELDSGTGECSSGRISTQNPVFDVDI